MPVKAAYNSAIAAKDEDASARILDGNGWYEVRRNPISKVGVFPYLGRSIDPALEPDKIYMVFRPEEELNNPETIQSFRLVPWVDDHPDRLLGPEEAGRVPAERKGVHGVTGEDVFFEDGFLYSNLKIFSDNLAEVIEEGKRELSVGYGCQYEISSGIWNGQRYDVIQRSIRGNHLATVKEGRMGPDVAVLDQGLTFTFDAKDIKMADEPKKDEDKQEGANLDEVMSMLKDLGESHAKVKGIVDKHFASDGTMKKDGCDADEDKEKDKEKEAGDAEEDKEKDKEAGDKKGMDEAVAAVRKESMDAVELLRKDVADWTANGTKRIMKELKQRDALASTISGFVGSFDASEMTLTEVAGYGVEKLGIKCQKGHEVTALDAFFLNRKPPTQELAFSLDAKLGADKSDASVADFYSKPAA